MNTTIILIIALLTVIILLVKNNEYKHIIKYDYLSELLNRRQFDLDFKNYPYKRKTDKLNLILIDIDKFKKINDTLGHAAGDNAIKHVGDVLKRTLRGSDRAYRLGGDEFAVVTDYPELIHKIKNHLNVEISYGVAVLTDFNNLGDAYKFADSAMYKNKSNKN